MEVKRKPMILFRFAPGAMVYPGYMTAASHRDPKRDWINSLCAANRDDSPAYTCCRSGEVLAELQ